METGEAVAPSVAKRPPPTPKAIINQKFGKEACYKTEQVQDSAQNVCPGLAIQQQGPTLYRCCLQLPELSVTSEPCTKKKDAEQAAAKMAIEKLGIQLSASIPSLQEAWDELVARFSCTFSNEFLSSDHPLTGHFREALRREGDLCGAISVALLLACDSKLSNLCKYINNKAESNILLSTSLIMKAARLSSSVATSEENLWISRPNSYSPDIVEALVSQKSSSVENIMVEATRIQCSMDKPVEPLVLTISSKRYYMDAIAEELGVIDSSRILISRPVGKASSETRFYFATPRFPLSMDLTADISNAEETPESEATLNARASYFSGQEIYGDAILAAIGFRWKSTELFHEHFPLTSYYRMLVGRQPDGGYKLSREALLAAELPMAFTTRSNWRGSLPRDLLCTFCRQNSLSEPEFTFPPETSEARKKLKTVHANGGTAETNGKESVGQRGTFRCEVKILSKNREVIMEYLPQDLYRKQSDAVQNTALKVLSWLDKYFKKQDMPLEKLPSYADLHVYPEKVLKELALSLSVHTGKQACVFRGCSSKGSDCGDQLCKEQQNGVHFLNIKGPDSGVYVSTGSLACISYSVFLMKEGERMKDLLEIHDEFEFEVGNRAVVPLLESCVTQISVNQCASFIADLPPGHLILATAGDLTKSLSQLSLEEYCLEYSVNLLQVTEPLEDRMEQALFSPPLSKQRVEYAWRHINESHATTLVDFGCGSGSLLDSLLDHPTALEKVVGVDISQKSLARAAKVLHSKLSTSSTSSTSIKSACLYDGSITVFDSRLYGFDIGTCLEVIEHMEEEQAGIFGDIVLSCFCPSILIVSTPNYEYNPILQKATASGRDEDGDDKSQSLPCRFRNHDHKFEWTREQFNSWASDLAARHNYSVEFSGVGGSADLEPGFASQIAVFKRDADGQCPRNGQDEVNAYEVIWEWSSSNQSTT